MFKLSHSQNSLGRSLGAGANQNEENPKILPLDTLVGLIDSTTLASRLEQVAIYLRSENKDLLFSDISVNLEAFLVRVIKDVHNLQSLLDRIDQKSRQFALEIIDLLKENENVFQLTYCYESHGISSWGLVYKKVFVNDTSPSISSESALINHFHKMCEENSVATGTHPPSRTDVILRHLSNIHRFLKDSTRRSVELSQMSYADSKRIRSLFTERDASKSTLYKLIWDELDILIKTHKLETSYIFLSNDLVVMKLDKVPLDKANSEKVPSTATAKSSNATQEAKQSGPSTARSSNATEETEESGKQKSSAENGAIPKLSRSQVVLDKKRKMLEVIQKPFINTTLKMIYNFLTNESEGSLLFRNANNEQCRFIQSACTMAKTSKIYVIFEDDTKDLLKKINQYQNANTRFDVKVDVSKMNKEKLRDVSLKKEPKELPKLISQSRLILKIPDVRAGIRMHNQTRSRSLDRHRVEFESAGVSFETPKVAKVALKLPHRPPPENIIASDKGEIKKRSQSLPRSEDIEKVLDANQNQYSLPTTTRKARLVADMSVPIKSDYAERIMCQMGWDGGPLGIRGDGLTEPLMPLLNLKIGAGLGHTPLELEPVTKRERQRQHASRFRYHLLQQILTLLTNDASEQVVEYKQPLTKCEKNLVKRLIGPLSNRSVHAQDEMCGEMLGRIMPVLDRQPDLKISGELTDQTHLKLTKVICAVKQKLPTGCIALPVDLPSARIRQKCKELPLKLNQQWNLEVGHLHNPQYAQRNAVKFGHQVAVLYKLLLFIRGNKREEQILSEYPWTVKQQQYLAEVIWKVNRKCKPSYTNPTENCMVNEMLLLMRDISLEVAFETKNIVILRKLAYMPNIFMNAQEVNENNNVVIQEEVTQVEVLVKEERIPYNEARALTPNEEVTPEEEVKEKSNVEDKPKPNPDAEVKAMPEDSTLSSNLTSEIKALQDEIMYANPDIEEDEMSTSSGKRSHTESHNSPKAFKKTRVKDQLVYLTITKKGGEITKEIAKDFQTATIDKIEISPEQPLIECCGLKNGLLTYCCHNEVGLLLVTSVANEKNLEITKVDSNVQIKHKVKLRMNLYVEMGLKKLFTKIERYNFGLSTDDWVVLNVAKQDDSIEVVMEIDDSSMEYICNAKFCLFAGVDKVRFTILWD